MTEVFANLAATAARARGMHELRTVVLPHPMESRADADVRSIARHAMRDIERLLTQSRR